MGNQKQKWTAEEEDVLHRGVQKYGAGKWKNILRDPEFAPSLMSRSNIDLKDKWRNLNVVTGQGSNIKSRTLKHKLPAPTAVTTPDPTLQFLLSM
ncbi:telomere repeat-binding factor 4-like [Lotus japonicus]|uniref:telomere repeat-binding factor 4-like n=1 Tax=Lotus japonicus TaxID=34305 RepID=UPI002582DB0D|nr:telomere repeat-binding factor 4-like [Lotus japonicus]